MDEEVDQCDYGNLIAISRIERKAKSIVSIILGLVEREEQAKFACDRTPSRIVGRK